MTYDIKCYPFFQDLCTKDLRSFLSCLNDAMMHNRSQKKLALATLAKSHTALKNTVSSAHQESWVRRILNSSFQIF